MNEETTVTLWEAACAADLPNRNDIWSGLGKVFLTSVDFWCPVKHDLVLSVGKSYKWRDRFGEETDFIAAKEKK